MNKVTAMFTTRTAQRIHKTTGAVAALVAWSFFGTVNNVMHVGAFATMLFWLALADFSGCILFAAWDIPRRITLPKKPGNDAKTPSADKNDLEKAA